MPTTEAAAIDQEQTDILVKVSKELLTDTEQEVIALTFVHSMSERKIATKLEKSKTWVHDTKQSALLKLRGDPRILNLRFGD